MQSERLTLSDAETGWTRPANSHTYLREVLLFFALTVRRPVERTFLRGFTFFRSKTSSSRTRFLLTPSSDATSSIVG
jgi:hypothetical protein